MNPHILREKRIQLAEFIIDELNRIRLGDPLTDINAKLGGLSIAIASILVLIAQDDETLFRAQTVMLNQIEKDIAEARLNKPKIRINTEEETREMLRKIGVLKTS